MSDPQRTQRPQQTPETQDVRDRRDADMARDDMSRDRDARDTRMDAPHEHGNGPRTSAQQPAHTELWPDMTKYHQRFGEIRSQFIEDPKTAVARAEQLVNEAFDHMARVMHEGMQSLHGNVEGKVGDTEAMRQTMRSYADWIDSVGEHHHHAA